MCPICADLDRELKHQCQLEAEAVDQQQEVGLTREVDDRLLFSRKRQLTILSTLANHRAREHAA